MHPSLPAFASDDSRASYADADADASHPNDMTSVAGSKRKRRWDITNGGRGSGSDVGSIPSLPTVSSSSCETSILVAAISASQKSAAPLRRYLSKRGAISSLLLLGGGRATSVNDRASEAQLSAALRHVSGQCIAQLLSVLYDEVQSNRNVEAVLRFVRWVLSVRFDVPCDGAFETIAQAQESRCEPITKDEGWIPCVVFMMAFKALTIRVVKLREQVGNDPDGKSVSFMADEVVSSSILLVERIRCMDVDGECVSSSTSMVERCFSSELSRFRSLVAELKRDEAALMTANHEDTERDSPKSASVPEPLPATEYGQDWWKGVDLGGDLSSSEEECSIGASEGPPIGKDATIVDASSKGYGINDKQAGVKATEKASGVDMKVSSSDTEQKASAGDEWGTIEGAALDLRAELVEMPPGATSADIQSYTDRISDLIKRAGTERGADGVAAIGSILHGNIASAARSAPVESTSSSPLTDTLVQQLCKTSIGGSTSAIRAAAFIRSFVLPLAQTVGTDVGEAGKKKKASAPSRILTATITSLAKERPIETIEALFVPMLVGYGEGNDAEGTEPNQTQADLVSKTIKTGQLSEEALSRFVVCLVADNKVASSPMILNDSTMPIVTTLLSKRPNISDETARRLTELIKEKAKEYCKNSKFSTLFHTLVTKNGASIQEAGCIDELVASADELKTFMGKSIKTALKKLSKK